MTLRPKKDSAACARAAKAPQKVPIALSSESDNCHWDGTESDKILQFFEPFTEPGAVNSGSATEWACEDGPLPKDDESNDHDRDLEAQRAVHDNSDRTQRRNEQKLREKEERDKVLRARYVSFSASARAFTNIFHVVPRTTPLSNAATSTLALAEPSQVRVLPPPEVVAPSQPPQPPPALSNLSPAVQINNATLPPPFPDNKIFTGYLSDISSGELSNAAALEISVAGAVPSPISTAIDTPATSSDTLIPHQIRPPPALKHWKFAVPQEERCRAAAIMAIAARVNILASSLTAINKLIASKKDVFHAGNASLQSYRARSIQSHLHMVVKNQKGWKLASENAADAQGFATKWGGGGGGGGGHMVRKWTRHWISDHVIPDSKIGKHGKSYLLYNGPIIRAELRSYIRREKWAMDPAKLVEFSEQKMVPAATDKYLRKITEEEMPAAWRSSSFLGWFLKLAVASLSAWHIVFFSGGGFAYTEHKKGLYYDGHERPDVVDDCQNRFLPAMAGHHVRLVEYKDSDVDTELDKM
ncbi:hypothetical protein C8R45DRAFT_939583 [Mycena sanguinolenta]|nr:hypothetical protein C8R45DRAFT_939583 [Mycena sanguinolenta]